MSLTSFLRNHDKLIHNLGFLGLFSVLTAALYVHGYLTRRLGAHVDLVLYKVELDFSMLLYASILVGCGALVCSVANKLVRLLAVLLFTGVYLVAFGDLFYFRLAGTYLDVSVALDNTGYTYMGIGIFLADRWLIIYFLMMCVNIGTLVTLCFFAPVKLQRVTAGFLVLFTVVLFGLNLWFNRSSDADLAFSLRPVLALGDFIVSDPLIDEATTQDALKEVLGYRKAIPAGVSAAVVAPGTPIFVVSLESVTPVYTMESLATDVAMPYLSALQEKFPVFQVPLSGAAHTMNGLISLLCGQLTRSEALVMETACLPRVLEGYGYSSYMWNVFNKMEYKHRRVFERMGFKEIYDSRALTKRDGVAPLLFMYDDVLYDYALRDMRAKRSLDYGLFFIGTNQTHFPGYSDHVSCEGSNVTMKEDFERYYSFFKSARCADRNLQQLVEEIQKMSHRYIIIVTADHPIDIGLGDIRLSDIGQVPLTMIINGKPLGEFFDVDNGFFDLGATYDIPTLLAQLVSGEPLSLGMGLGPLSPAVRDYVVSISSTCKLGLFGNEVEEYASCIPFARNLGMRLHSNDQARIPAKTFEAIFEAAR